MPTIARRSFRFASCALLLSLLASAYACGGATPKGAGSDGLYSKTFAGQNKCNPKNADRPFIIDWDATDQSSFQAQAQNDVVFVRYEGCDLKVLYGCRDDDVKGAFGSYKNIEWTSGGVEMVDIHDEGELYAKLPLGAASLGGRVESGEKFHMEYYVSGTRTATRDKVYRGDLSKRPACAGATHFVYQYNLGAFALASTSKLKGEVNGSFFGFGTGGGSSNETSAEKKGGEIAACKADASNIVDACKVPVRLTLREISDENNPTVAAASAPESDAALNLAGKVKAESDNEKKASEHLISAQEKLGAKDGKACLADLDQHDALDPRPSGLSTNPKAYEIATLRAKCLDLAGKCDAGRELYKKALDGKGETPSKDLDKKTEELAFYCMGGKLTPREQYVAAAMTVADGAQGSKKVDAKTCMASYATMKALHAKLKPTDRDDYYFAFGKTTSFLGGTVPECLGNAGDCPDAYKLYLEIDKSKEWRKEDQDYDCMLGCAEGLPPPGPPLDEKEIFIKKRFEVIVPMCKGKE